MRDGGANPLQIGQATLSQHTPLSTRDFAYVKEHGKRLTGRFVIVGYVPAPDEETRLGIVVSKRYNTRAVKRNRARRLIRECFRLTQNAFVAPTWIVIIGRRHLHGRKLQELQDEVVGLLTDAGVMDISIAP